jgi:hypothetical protein
MLYKRRSNIVYWIVLYYTFFLKVTSGEKCSIFNLYQNSLEDRANTPTALKFKYLNGFIWYYSQDNNIFSRKFLKFVSQHQMYGWDPECCLRSQGYTWSYIQPVRDYLCASSIFPVAGESSWIVHILLSNHFTLCKLDTHFQLHL